MLAPRSDFLWHRILLHGRLQLVRSELDDLCQSLSCPGSAADLVAFEQRIGQLTQRLHALLAAVAVQTEVCSPGFREATRLLVASSPSRLKNQGWRPVSVRFAA